ncbi:MAG: hypothetical protein QI199_04395, partial [Candidatus Korarchaeota archaeon]|nr:hypothetical protein [Candidatus Korarchaeota archaeon]
GRAMIAVRILDGRGWRFVPTGGLEETGSGYKASLEAIEAGLRLRDILGMADEKAARMDEYLGGEGSGEEA